MIHVHIIRRTYYTFIIRYL